MVGTRQRDSSVDPKLQDLRDTGPQQDNREEVRGEPNIAGVTGARDLKPDP